MMTIINTIINTITNTIISIVFFILLLVALALLLEFPSCPRCGRLGADRVHEKKLWAGNLRK